MMRRSTVLALLLAASFLPWTAVGQSEPAPAVDYELVLSCPGQSPLATCPIRATDPDDAMGDPAIAVDPDRPSQMIIASLHGSGDAGGPSAKSRNGQTFTTFTTQDGGGVWIDNPFFPPGRMSGAYGQHPAITIDPYGHVFIGSLYAQNIGGSTPEWEYTIAAQKFRSLREINDRQDGSYQVEYIPAVHEGNVIRQMWYVYDRATDHMVMLWTEHAPGNPPEPSLDLLQGLGESTAQQDVARSVIGMTWTGSSRNSPYRTPDTFIGPCSTSTNPVISEGWLYVGCKVADEGPLPWDANVTAGDIVLFRMRPDEGTPHYLGPTPLSGGMPKLGVRSDGRIAVVAAAAQDGTLRLDAVYGQYAPSTGRVVWGPVAAHGDAIPTPGATELVEANIQDLIYREYSGVLHMVLKQVVEPAPGATVALGVLQPAFHKSIIAIDEAYGLLAHLDLDVGNPINRSSDPVLVAMTDPVFNDIADDFLELPGAPFSWDGRSLGPRYEREFFAVGDYGQVIFAEIIELTTLRGPSFAGPPPPPPPPVPAPAPAAVSTLVPAAALTAAAITTGSLAHVKRRHISGAGKKKRN